LTLALSSELRALPSSLVIQTSFLGDVVLTTPLIAHLARSGPVDVVTTPAAAPLLAGNPDIRRVIPFDKRGAEGGLAGLWEVARAVRAEGDAVAYCAQGSLRSAALATLGGYRERVGFDTSGGRLLYSRRVTYRAEQHHVERLLRLAVGDDATIDPAALVPSLHPSSRDRDAIDLILARQGATEDRLVALAPGSVWATKRWPGFPALAKSLAPNGRIVVIGGDADRDVAAAILEGTPDAIDTTGRLSLLGSAALIRRAAVLVTNDSLPQHLASAMGTRTVTIFGPTIPGFGFGPLAPGSVSVGHASLTCRPCHPHGPAVCPLGHHLCMRDLAESVVLSHALNALAA
jgi:heptosyltransferase-2